MEDYYDLCCTLEDIRLMEYNRMCKEDLLSEDEIDFHWDDDFVWHHHEETDEAFIVLKGAIYIELSLIHI